MGLVENDGRVALEQRIIHRLAQEHTIGEVSGKEREWSEVNLLRSDTCWPRRESRLLEEGLGRGDILETDVVAHFLAKHHIHLITHTLGDAHRGHSTRLRTTHQLLVLGVACVHQELRDLGGFAVAQRKEDRKKGGFMGKSALNHR